MTYTIELDPTAHLWEVWGEDDEAPALLGGYTTRKAAIAAAALEFPDWTHVEKGRGTDRWYIVEPGDGFYLPFVSFASREDAARCLRPVEAAA